MAQVRTIYHGPRAGETLSTDEGGNPIDAWGAPLPGYEPQAPAPSIQALQAPAQPVAPPAPAPPPQTVTSSPDEGVAPIGPPATSPILPTGGPSPAQPISKPPGIVGGPLQPPAPADSMDRLQQPPSWQAIGGMTPKPLADGATDTSGTPTGVPALSEGGTGPTGIRERPRGGYSPTGAPSLLSLSRGRRNY